MIILGLNCGSSSLKYQLIDMTNEEVIAKGICERVGSDNACISFKTPDGEKVEYDVKTVEGLYDYLYDMYHQGD